MLRPWRAELRVGLSPTRLVLPGQVRAFEGAPLTELGKVANRQRLTVVLSSHFVRYALLPWSDALTSEEEWLALGHHTLNSIYGATATSWDCRVSPAGRGEPRLASAIDAPLLAALRSVPGVVSVQPYLMAAFNALRKTLSDRDGWFVIQEPGRLTLALKQGEAWRRVRVRRVGEDWHRDLQDILDREAAADAAPGCDEILLYGEDEAPERLGRFRVSDLMLSGRPRSAAMVCH